MQWKTLVYCWLFYLISQNVVFGSIYELQYLIIPFFSRSKSGSKIAEPNGKSRILGWMSTAQRCPHLQLVGSPRGPTPGAYSILTGSHTRSRVRDPMPRTFTTWQLIITIRMEVWGILIRDYGNALDPKILGWRKRTIVHCRISEWDGKWFVKTAHIGVLEENNVYNGIVFVASKNF